MGANEQLGVGWVTNYSDWKRVFLHPLASEVGSASAKGSRCKTEILIKSKYSHLPVQLETSDRLSLLGGMWCWLPDCEQQTQRPLQPVVTHLLLSLSQRGTDTHGHGESERASLHQMCLPHPCPPMDILPVDGPVFDGEMASWNLFSGASLVAQTVKNLRAL